MIYALLTESNNPKKKYKVIVSDGQRKKTIHFGQAGASDYLQHKNDTRKFRYIQRHSGMGEDWTDPFTAGWWALNLLWSQKTMEKSIKDIEKRNGIIIFY